MNNNELNEEDEHASFEFPDNLEPQLTESGDLKDDSNPSDDDYE